MELVRAYAGADVLVYTLRSVHSPDPEAYLRAVITCIADYPIKRIDELVPWNIDLWLQQRT